MSEKTESGNDYDHMQKPFDSEEEWGFNRLRDTTQRAAALLEEGSMTSIDPTEGERKAYLGDLANLLDVVAQRLSDLDITWNDFAQQAKEAHRSGLYPEHDEFLHHVLTATLDPEYLEATRKVREKLEQATFVRFRHQRDRDMDSASDQAWTEQPDQ